jgi:hypothetical protein
MESRTQELANAMGALLAGEDLDHVIPALAMMIAHAATLTSIPNEDLLGFIGKTMRLLNEDETTTH